MENSRRKAAFIVSRWLLTHDFPNEMLPQSGPDRAFVQDLVYTTVRRFRALRTVLGELLKTWPKGELEALVLIGAAQILYMPDVPDFAAVNETVAAAKMSGKDKRLDRVVNGVLRNLIRRRAEFEAKLAAAPLAERESYPNALVARWTARYGAEGAEKLAKWHNTPAETWLAYPPERTAGIASFPSDCAAGVRVPENDVSKIGGATVPVVQKKFVLLPRGAKVADVPGYEDGAFIVQDPATAGAIDLLDVKPGLSVLDACAAPGGKTVQIAWRLNGQGRLVAQEVNPKRLRRLQANLARLHLGWVEAVTSVETVASSGEAHKTGGATVSVARNFDRVLVDAPCSNTGVLRRRPDARWRWDMEHLKQLTDLQRQILEAASAHVALGGLLVYSTCSNEPEENADQIAAFLAAHPDFTEVKRYESVPFESGHDGAFASALARKA